MIGVSMMIRNEMLQISTTINSYYRRKGKKCLFEGNTVYREQVLFEHKKHDVFTVNKCKIALNRDDDKRIIQED